MIGGILMEEVALVEAVEAVRGEIVRPEAERRQIAREPRAREQV
jgi:hypothetical protein